MSGKITRYSKRNEKLKFIDYSLSATRILPLLRWLNKFIFFMFGRFLTFLLVLSGFLAPNCMADEAKGDATRIAILKGYSAISCIEKKSNKLVFAGSYDAINNYFVGEYFAKRNTFAVKSFYKIDKKGLYFKWSWDPDWQPWTFAGDMSALDALEPDTNTSVLVSTWVEKMRSGIEASFTKENNEVFVCIVNKAGHTPPK